MRFQPLRHNGLFWKITGVFTLLLILLGIAYAAIAFWMSRKNLNTINEQINGDIAAHLARNTTPMKDGKPDTAVTHDIIHSIMVINPSVEVYLLDTSGKIVDFVVPGASVKTSHVDLTAIRQYMRDGAKKYVTGDNPRNPDQKTVFSAAPIHENNRLSGYVYAVLSSEKQARIAAAVNKDFLHNLGATLFFATLLVVFIVGTATFFLITGNVYKIASVVKRFKDGDHTARIEGNLKGDLGVLTSTFNEMADTIVDNMEKLTSMDRLRQELIANISHDLRSPLAITRGYIETLTMKGNTLTDQEIKRYLSIITSSLQKLSHLVEQLFEYSKFEANQILPQKEAFFLSELVSDLIAKYEILAKQKGITLNADTRTTLPLVFADLALVERAVQNLLDNALKFTPAGGSITITLRNRGKNVELAIADTGIGIPGDDQPYIFDRYKQFPDHELTNKEGTGLGLAIVKKILDLHHSTITVTSQPGQGTTFWFQLPIPG
ncbi:MAG: HAMP domain-containing histidine kinase [Bacteroidetes bacterium]|nr:HAMP domain-containing histidine kinase [Bacteroidota bacterium]